MKNLIFGIFIILTINACRREEWIFNTHTCSKFVVPYDEKKIENINSKNTTYNLVGHYDPKRYKSLGVNYIDSSSYKWYNLKNLIINKYYYAKIKGGDRYIIVVKSRRRDKEEIKQIICDYWK